MIIKNKNYISEDRNIVFRSARDSDAEQIRKHRIIVASETYWMSRYPEECEKDIKKIEYSISEWEKHPQNLLIVACENEKIVGEIAISQIGSHLKYLHRGHLGISIQQAYCNLGVGSKMVELALEQAKKNGFEQIELGVFADNARAIHLYEKYGFHQCGVWPRAFKLKNGTYIDEIIMVKFF